MYLTRSEYDRGVNTFSPEGIRRRDSTFFSPNMQERLILIFGSFLGRLFQVEYAIEAIKLGTTAIGIQTAEGTVLAVEKRITSSLLVPSSIKKLEKLDKRKNNPPFLALTTLIIN